MTTTQWMERTRRWGMIPFLAGVLLAAVPAFPKDEKGSDGKPAEHLGHRYLAEELGLTDAQRKELREQRAALRKRLAELSGEIKVQKAELQNEMEKPQPDRKKLERITQRISELQGMRTNEKIQANLDAEKVLTPEQREKWRELKRAARASKRSGSDED